MSGNGKPLIYFQHNSNQNLISLSKTEHKDQRIINLLKSRTGIEAKVELKDGRLISIWNIAWGYDMGDEFAHITTNISPNIDNVTTDFFYTNEIHKILISEE